MAKINGTSSSDALSGTNRSDKIKGKDGDDTLHGLAGNDKLYGGDGNDLLVGGSGKDKLKGDDGSDTLEGGSGNDDLSGGDGNDSLDGGTGNDDLEGGDGNDTLDGGTGNDDLEGGGGNDILLGGDGRDKLEGDDGNDQLDGGDDDDTLTGGDGSDTLLGGAGNDVLIGDGSGGGSGHHKHRHGSGSGAAAASTFDDYLDGGAGNDLMFGGAGNDTLLGGSGNDMLFGGDGSDSLLGGTGNDVLIGDSLGGSGRGSGSGRRHGSGSGSGAAMAGGFDDYLDGGAGNDIAIGGQGADTVLGSDGDDLVFGDELSFKSGSGSGSGHGKKHRRGSGSGSGSGDQGFNDYLDGGAGNDFVLGGGGDDEAVYSMAENSGASDDYRGGRGIDTLTLNVTSEEWFRPDVQADVANYLAFLAANTNASTGEANSAVFQFTAFDLSAREFENLRVLVDGIELDPTDEAVDAIDDFAGVSEDAAAVGFPSVLLNDDVPDLAQSVTLVSGPAAGILVFNEGTPAHPLGNAPSVGSFTFDPNGEFEDLAEGELRDVTFTYEVTDADGDTDQATVTITVTGTNDAPSLAASVAAAVEDGPTVDVDLTALGTDIDSDDDGTSLTYTVTGAPAEGSASITGGTLTFDPGSDFQNLALNETRDVVVQVTATDAHGATAVNDVVVTVTGTNDAPTITTGFGTAVEDGPIVSVDLAPLAGDVDSDDTAATLSYAIPGVPSEGSAVFNGSVLEFNPGSDFQDLAVGETRDVVINTSVTDAHGAVDTSTVTITVTGTNDAPSLAASVAAAVEGGPTVDVDLTALGTDIDSDDDGTSLTYTVSVAPAEGSASITGGTLTFDPGTDFQNLALNETKDVTIQVTASDTHGATAVNDVVVTVTGTNDAPVIGVSSVISGDVVEAGNLDDGTVVSGTPSATGTMVSTDVDTGATATWSGNAAGAYGAFAINPSTGTWTYTLDNNAAATNALAEGQVETETFAVTVTDEHNATATEVVTITVSGTNDSPVAVADTAAATAGEAPAANLDAIAINDTAGGGGTFYTQMLTNDGTGVFLESLTGGPAIRSSDVTLGDFDNDGDLDAFVGVYSGDGQLLLNQGGIQGGTEGVFVTTTIGQGSLPSLGGFKSTYTLDVEAGDVNGDGNLDIVVANWNGQANQLLLGDGAGGFAVSTLAGGSRSTRDIRLGDIDGDGDLDAIATTDQGINQLLVNQGGAQGGGQGSFVATNLPSVVNQFGSLSIGADIGDVNGDGFADVVITNILDQNELLLGNGAGGFTPTTLAGGLRQSTSIRLADLDGDGDLDAFVTNNGNQLNQVLINQGGAQGGTEGSFVASDIAGSTRNSASVALVDIDQDGDLDAVVANNSFNTSAVPDQTNQIYLNDGAGNFTVAPLGDGNNPTNSIEFGDLNGDGGVPAVNAKGLPNLPLGSPVSSLISGSVATNDGDVDTGASLSYAIDTAIAGLTLASDGSYVFDANDPAYSDLAEGESKDFVATYIVTDEFGATAQSTLTITVTGTNDAPTLAASVAAAVEGGPTVDVDLTALGTDIDSDDDGTSLTYTVSVAPAEGSASITGGTLTFDPGTDFQNLALNETKDVTIQVTASDTHGATAVNDVVVTVTGTNDAPVIGVSSVISGDVVEAGNLDDGTVVSGTPSATGTMVSTDVDTGATATWSGNAAGAYGAFAINPSTGTWTYTLDNNAAATNALAEGQVETETFAVTVTDEHNATATEVVTITVSGTNDSPVANDVTLVSGPADPTGWTYNADNGHYYQVVDTGSTFAEAQAGAAALGGYLATITTASEQAFIEANGLIAVTDGTWIGGQSSNPANPGAWTWVTGPEAGQSFSYDNWRPTEPNGGFSAPGYAQLLQSGEWNDAPDSLRPGNGIADGYLVEWGGRAQDTGFDEDTVLTIGTAQLLANDTDVDAGAILTVTAVSALSAAGVPVSLSGTDISYDPTAVFNHLAAGESATDTFTYTVTDEFGAIDTATVTLTIEGRNDGPVAVADTNAGAAVVESGVTPGNIPFAGNDTATGNLLDNDTDVDATDMLSVSEVNGQAANVAGSVAGTYGTVVINSDGGYTYTLLNNAPATEALPQDETAQDVFTYTVDDGNGGTDTATLTIDITGTNDAPTITTGFGTAVEDGPIVSVDLAPLAGDVDSDDTAATLSYAIPGVPSEGSAVFNGSVLEFNPGSDFQDLAVGETRDVVINTSVTDAHGAVDTSTVTITVTGTNDAPSLAASVAAAVEGGPTVDVDLTALGTDIDSDDDGTSLTYTVSVAPAEGSASITGGTLTFDPGTDFQNLALNETKDVTIQVTASDTHGATAVNDVVVTVTGTNDAPVIGVSSVISGDVVEAGNLDDGTVVSGTPSATGTMVSTDVDTGATATWSGNAAGAYGAFAINPSTGTWTYTLDNNAAATNALAEGQVETETFAVTVTDEHNATATEVVTITVSGTNDSPVANDVTLVSGPADPTGWTYNADNGHYYQVVDTGSTFAEAQAGAAALGGYLATITTASEQAFIEANGLIAVTDGTWIGGQSSNPANPGAWTWVTGPEAGQSFSYDNWRPTEPNGGFSAPGYAQLLQSGEWNDAPDSLRPGNGIADGYLVEWGGRAQDTGFDEDTVLTIGTAQLLANDTDVDAGAILTVTAVSALSAAGVPVSLSGTDISYDPTAVFNHLAAGESATDTFTYTVTDEFGAIDTATVTLTIEGRNDGPVAVADTNAGAAVVEQGFGIAGNDTATGNLLANDTDVDASDVLSVTAVDSGTGEPGSNMPVNPGLVQIVPGRYGSLAIEADGTWTYNLNDADPDTNALAQGTTAQEVFTYTVDDGNGGTDTAALTIDITGTNDAPTLAAGVGVAVEDGSSVNVDLSVLGADIDSDDDGSSLTYTVTGAPGEGSASITGGTLTFDPGADFQDLALDETRDVTIQVTAKDAHGATAVNDVVITVTGTNDWPVATNDNNASDALVEQGFGVVGDSAAAGDVLANDSDVDSTDVLAVVSVMNGGNIAVPSTPGGGMSITGVYGSLALASDGTWTYALDNDDPDTEALENGDTAFEVFTYTVSDGNGGTDTATLTLEIAGSGDNVAPVAVDDTFTVTEDTPTSLTPLGNDTDANNTPVVTQALSIVSINGVAATVGAVIATTNGSITIGAGGAVDYTPNANYSGADSFSYTVNDGLEESNTGTVNLNIAPVNDTPVIAPITAIEAGFEETIVDVNDGMLGAGSSVGNPGYWYIVDFDSPAGAQTIAIERTSSHPNLSASEIPTNGVVMHINPNGGSPSDNAVTGRGDFGVSVTSYDNGVATTRPVSEITAPNYDGTPEEIYPDALSFFTSTNGIGINWVGSNIDVPGGTANVRMSLSGIDYVDGIGALTLDSVEVQVSPAIMSGQIAFDDPDIGDSHVAIATGVTLSGTTNGLPPALALAFLNVSVSSSPTAGAPGTIDWTFNPGMLGLDFLRPGESLTFDFVIEVDDAQPAWDTETLSITIHGADNLPEVFDGPQSTLEDTVLDGTSFTYEPDGEPLSFSVLTDVSNGTLVLDSITGDYSYTPDLNYNGTDSFTYLIDDGTGGIVSSTVTIDVGAVNDDPTLAAAALGTVEDAGVETVLDLTTLGDDVDVDDDPTTLEYTITGHPSEGTATLDGTDLKFDPGTAFQTLAEGETRDVVVQITATDAHNATAVNDVTITVTGTNDAPTMSNVTILTNEDAGTGSFDSSGILENGDVETLGNWLGSNYLSLENVFTKDAGDTSVDWHTAVNGVGPTITIIELDNGNIIGGYTPISWSNTTGYSLEYNSGAFLFNLSTDTQYEQGSNPHVIYNSINHGPTFGGGHDLYVNSTLTGGYGNIGYYYGDRSQAGTSEYREEFTGTYNTWTIVGLETFTLSSGAGNPVTTLDLSTIGDDIDSDDDGASLVYTITDLPNAGEATISGNTLIFNPDGEFEYLNDGENATVEIEVTATDAHGVSTSSIVTVVVEGRDEVVTVRVEESDQQHTTTAASGANGVFGGTGVDGTNGFAGSNGASANAIQLNETYVGAGNNDTLVLSADASGGNGGYGGNGGSGGSGQYLNNSYTGGNSATPADPYTNQLNYGQAGDGADGGAGGSGGTASAQLDGNLLDGQGGSDSLLFEVDAAGGIGSFGGNGGSGGFGGDTGSYGYRITNSSSWVTAYSYYQQDYNGGNHGDTGDGARGGSGGFAQAYADSNTGLGGDGDDIITVDVSAVGGLAGRGGTAQGARGNAPSVADASAGTSGDGGVGGAALAEARDNTLNGGADNDILTVIVKAEGGDGLYGGNGDAGEIGTDYLNTTNGSTGAFRGQSYTDTVYYYGDGSNGGDGGDGGDAMSRVIGNELLGGDGQDQLALEAIAVAGSGGNGGVGYATSDGGPYGGNRTYSYVGGDAGATGQAGVQGDATAIVTGNILSGGADDDTLSVSFGLSGRYNSLTFDGNTFDGGAGFDTLDLSGIAVSTGLAGAQTSVGAVIDMAAETLVVGGSGSNTVTGIEYLVGTQGDDVITGTNSADRINASGGADVITLGAGADVFEFSDGHNTITDFDIAEDRIQLGGNNLSFGFVDRDFNGVVNASDPTTVGTGGYNFSNDGAGNLVITVSDDPSRQVTLVGVTELYEDDFIF